jgi:hypothetical protein
VADDPDCGQNRDNICTDFLLERYYHCTETESYNWLCNILQKRVCKFIFYNLLQSKI